MAVNIQFGSVTLHNTDEVNTLPVGRHLTQDKRYTLSKSSKNILNKIDDILTIKVYLDGDLPTGFQMLNSSINNFLTNCTSLP